MNQHLSVIQVFEKYGFSLFEGTQPEDKLHSISDSLSWEGLKKNIWALTDSNESVLSIEQYLTDHTCFHLLEWIHCKITNFDSWLNRFRIQSNSLPFPKDDLACLNFFFLVHDTRNANLVAGINGAFDYAEAVGKNIEDVRKEMFFNFELMHTFQPKQAIIEAEDRIDFLIDALDNLPDPQCVELFKKELFEVTLREAQIDRDELISLMSQKQT